MVLRKIFILPACIIKFVAFTDAFPQEYISECLKRQLAVQEVKGRYYIALDPELPELIAKGTLEKDGTLNLTIVTKSADGIRSPVLKAREQFAEILKRFGPKVKRIRGFWGWGDNLEKFNDLTGPPYFMNPRSAAVQTWTGTQASMHGFTEIEFEELKGTPGNYFDVEVLFSRPE